MASVDQLMTFDKLIQEIGARFHLGSKGRSLVQETLDLIARQPSGVSGFLDRFKAAGFAAEVDSWVEGTDAVPLSGQEVEETLGSGFISEIADKAGVSQRVARTILGYAIPRIIGQLAKGALVDLAVPLSSSHADEISQPGLAQIPPSTMGGGGAPGRGRLLIPGACLLITLGVLGYAISSGRKGAVAVQRAPVTAQNAPAASTTRVAPSKPAAPPPEGAVAVQRAPVTAQNAPAASTARVAPSKPAAPSPSASIPARLALSNENGLIGYSGTVGDDATRSAITDSLKSVFGADKITGDLAVDQHVGQAGWAKDLKLALDDLKTPGSQALFEGNTIRVGGTIPDADRDRIMASVKSEFGPQFEVATLAGSGATKTAAAQVAPSPGVSGEHLGGASNQPTLHLPDIYFASKSADVPSSSEARLRQAAGLIKQLPAGTEIQISGYTDPAGNPAANLKLSQQRADAVRQVLVDAGVNPAMLSAKGYGTTERRSNVRKKSRPREDRRVEFRIVQK